MSNSMPSSPENHYFITHFFVENLWGYKTYALDFHEDVNVIIGPNASGKTTLINILYDALTGNLPRLCRTQFTEVLIRLRAFEGNAESELRLCQTQGELKITIDDKTFRLSLLAFQRIADDGEIPSSL